MAPDSLNLEVLEAAYARGLAAVERLLRGLEADCRRTGLAAREAAGAGLTLLLATLCRTFEDRFADRARGDGAPAQAARRLARVAAYLADAYRGEVTLAAAAVLMATEMTLRVLAVVTPQVPGPTRRRPYMIV